jgi:hypothetical protein
MRYKHGWDNPREDLPNDSIDNCLEITQKAFDLGINHIETAYGYGKSEGLYGIVLPQLKKRDEYFLMTKGTGDNVDHFKERIEEQLKTLKTDYIDFYAYHGINDQSVIDHVFHENKLIDVLVDYKRQGIIKNIGFSTHGDNDAIVNAINYDCFDFVNLHYYYFNQMNREAVELAGKKDMGVLIISPNDKGGQLWNPSAKVKEACKPLSAISFNGKYCLSHPQITTLIMGFHEDSHFTQPLNILNDNKYGNDDPVYSKVLNKMDGFKDNSPVDSCITCYKCLPCPEKIHIPEVLRMYDMDQFYDMKDFGKYRYNMFQEDDHWFAGRFAKHCTECGECIPRCPINLDIPTLVQKAHKEFFIPKEDKK